MKRADITSEMVLAAVRGRGNRSAIKVLCEMYKCEPKVAWRALEREESYGNLDCGVSIKYCWVVEKEGCDEPRA